ncbi:hypothetical protein [Pontibacter arcticus]|uniref:Uncharacterized protein n=1 Tax=Pontibacter arcticus TaxID=2080288 RepID=A0A364RB66_9BACT|nr:hypothetical protein [Pontibacter arcticus]RAU81477.1 hypothetical protein DP923_15305 [Pontibacter arcticus]
MKNMDIKSLLDNIEKKVCQQEITSDSDVTRLINNEINSAINLKSNPDAIDQYFKNANCTTLECYLQHLQALEEKLKAPSNITAQCKAVEERDINRRLLLILNRIKGFSRKQ